MGCIDGPSASIIFCTTTDFVERTEGGGSPSVRFVFSSDNKKICRESGGEIIRAVPRLKDAKTGTGPCSTGQRVSGDLANLRAAHRGEGTRHESESLDDRFGIGRNRWF
jgi:hypothetical protein